MLPQVGVGGGTPTPRKPSAASMTMATPRWVVASTRYGATHWGRTCTAITRSDEAPLAPSRLHEGHLAHRQRHRADDAPAEGDARDGDGEDDRLEPGADGHGDGHGEDEVGEGLEDLHDALAHEIEAPAQVAAGHAPQRADRRPEEHGGEGHEQRGARAVDHAAQGVAADLVGAQEALGVGRLVHAPEIGLERIAGREHRRRDGHEDDEETRPRRRWRTACCAGRSGRARGARCASAVPDARVEPRVAEVHEHVDRHEDRRVEQHEVLDDDDVALDHRDDERAARARARRTPAPPPPSRPARSPATRPRW